MAATLLTAAPRAGDLQHTHANLQDRRGFPHNGWPGDEARHNRGERPADGLCNLNRETGKAYRRLSVADVVPESPGKHHRGSQPPARIAGAGR
jgi:hypothetical protein